MNQEDIIDIIQLASIVITGGLGIAGTITHTKTEKGDLTKWGKITVIGIMVANSFSFIQSYLKQQQTRREQINSVRKEMAKSDSERVKFQQTTAMLNNTTVLLNVNLKKSDSSLEKQKELQDKTGTLLSEMHKVNYTQDQTFTQSKVLNAQQQKANEDIERTLNPLLPFKIDLSFSIRPEPGSIFSIFTTSLDVEIKKNIIETDIRKNPFSIIANKNDTSFLIHSTYGSYDYFIDRMNFLNIVLTLTRMDKNGSIKTLKCEVPKYFFNAGNLKDFTIIYLQTRHYYMVEMDNLPVKVLEYAGSGFNSTKDLKDATLRFQISDAPASIGGSGLIFKFPPDFSRINKLLIPKENLENANAHEDGGYMKYYFMAPVLLKDE